MNVLANVALALVVPAYLIVLAAVVLLAIRRSAQRDARRCPRRGVSAW
ncbi:MAG: hypothetical protein M3291_01490 [Actinomycetota bacterium]|nr:hypothetical protein [Actinomycetota bacterium]